MGVWGLVHDRCSRIHPLSPHHRRLPIDHRAGRGVGDGLSYPGAHVETEINTFLRHSSVSYLDVGAVRQ